LARVETDDEAMGTTFSIVAYGDDRAHLERAVAAAMDEAHRLDALLSNYRPDSEWSRVNRGASTALVSASPELFALLDACLAYSRTSDGAFDITVGPLMKVWGFYKGEGQLPRAADVASAMARVGYRHITLDRATRTVRFDVPGIEMDPGGIGKGYAVDRMIDVLRGRGVTIAKVSAGGSSIFGLGAPPDEPRGWPVPIRTPGTMTAVSANVFLRDMSISTSGSYEKFFWADGRRYAHIFDPRTGYPSLGTSLVSVVAPRTIDSEAWTKPYFINGRDWASSHRAATVKIFLCDDAPAVRCGWID
jgi:thiamine biosynthesis lipoprotein